MNQNLRLLLHSIGAAGALDLSFMPKLLILFIPNYQNLGMLTTMNLFFLTLGGTMAIMALLVRIFGKNLFRPRIRIDPRVRQGAQVIVEWFKEHDGFSALALAGAFGFFLFFVVVLGRAFPSIDQPMFGPPAALGIEIFLTVIIAPGLIAGAIYEGIVHPTGPLTSDELESVIRMHPETELTRRGLEVAAKTKVQVINKRTSWMPISLLVVAMAFMELAGYGLGTKGTSTILVYAATFLSLIGICGFLLLTIMSRKESQYELIMKESQK